MSHMRAICARSAIIAAMSRLVLLAVVVAAGGATLYSCTKSPASQEGSSTKAPEPTKVTVPGDEGAATAPGTPGGMMKGNDPVPATAGGGENSALRLSAEEGQLAVIVPPDAKAGAEVTARVTVTANEKYKVNVEFPTKLTLETPSGVTVAKALLTAGGHDKSQGDAAVFGEKQMEFAVKLTPAASGNYTINGSFKFAVCDRAGTQCLPKKEPIAIQLAAK